MTRLPQLVFFNVRLFVMPFESPRLLLSSTSPSLRSDAQFNYMHECFERVFCELKWRNEVSARPAAPLVTAAFVSI